MYDQDTIKNLENAIQTICKTAVAVWNTLDEDGSDLIDRLEQIAASIQQHFELEGGELEQYRSMMGSMKQLGIKSECSMSYRELEKARDVVYALCDKLEDPKEIMRYVRTACEMIEVWYPEPAAS